MQQEILNLYATELAKNKLKELKIKLANFFAKKAIQAADKIWDEEGYSAEEMVKCLKKLLEKTKNGKSPFDCSRRGKIAC